MIYSISNHYDDIIPTDMGPGSSYMKNCCNSSKDPRKTEMIKKVEDHVMEHLAVEMLLCHHRRFFVLLSKVNVSFSGMAIDFVFSPCRAC